VPLIVEDGTGSDPTANSYAARADIIVYAAARGVTLTDDAATDVLGIAAMDYLETRDYKGDPTYGAVGVDQPLAWPRTSVTIGLVTLAPDAMPLALKNAQCELALQKHNGIDLTPVRAGGQLIKAEKLDVIETEYFETSGMIEPVMPRVDALLKPLIRVGFGPLTAIRV
jgi:hypothetical protein